MSENLIKSKNKFHKDTFDKTTEDRRQKLLEVAIEEFAAKGYSATSINDIARKAQVSIGAMYSYFASKEDLFLTIINNSYFIMEDVLRGVVENSKDVFDCIEKMLVTSRTFALEFPQLNHIYLDLTTQALAPMSVRLSHKLEIITPKLLRDVMIQGKKDGLIGKDLDEGVIAYTLDNIFMLYQFSFSSDYYKERMKIFVGEDKIDNIEEIEKNILQFIYKALRLK